MHKENILMTVELRELWSPSRTALMALKCSSGRRGKAMRTPWPGPVLKLTFQGTHSPHRRSQVQGPRGKKRDTKTPLLTGSRERIWVRRDFPAQPSVSQAHLGCAVIWFLAGAAVGWGKKDYGQMCLGILHTLSVLLPFCILKALKILAIKKIYVLNLV